VPYAAVADGALPVTVGQRSGHGEPTE
jgi:hypothetical protein